jgi:PKD repeat protein
MQSANTAQDVQQVLSARIDDLKPGETRMVAFAFLAGDNLADLQANAVTAKTKFNQVKTAPLPTVASTEFCKDERGAITPLNGKNFSLYNSLPLSTPVAKGSTFDLGKVTRDSTYYLVCTDSLFESNPLTIEVKAVKHSASFDMAQDTIGLYEGEVLQVTDRSSNATKWQWSFGDSSASIDQNPTHLYVTPGKYTIKLISENSLGCKDSLTKEVLVVNGKKSLKPLVSDKVLCNGEKLVLSPANGVKFNLYNQLPLTTPLLSGTFFELGSLTKDTLFYITCTDFLLESEPAVVYIRVSSHTSSFSMEKDTLDLRLQQQLQLTDKSVGATEWHWNFGDGQTSSEQNPTHAYALPGEYTITLVSKNNAGCESTSTLNVLVVQTTGLEGDISKYIQISPNPSEGKFIISLAESLSNVEWDIQITNLLGQKVYKYSTNSQQATVDLSTYNRGQYIIRIKSGNQVITRKLILL